MKLEIVNLKLQYQYDEFSIFDDLNLQIVDNERVGVYIDVMSGKTSLARMLVDNVLPFSGNILYNGVDIERVKHSDRNIGFLSSSPVLFEGKTVRYNLEYVLKIRKQLDSAQVDDVLARFDLAQVAATKVNKLAQLQKRLVQLARLSLVSRDLLVVDDFCNDVDSAPIVAKFLEQTHCAQLILSSNVDAFSYCDRVYVVEDKKTVLSARPNEAIEYIKTIKSYQFNNQLEEQTNGKQ